MMRVVLPLAVLSGALFMADTAVAADPITVTVETIDAKTGQVVQTFKDVPAWRNEKNGKWDIASKGTPGGLKTGDRFTHESKTYTITKTMKSSAPGGRPSWLCEVKEAK